MSWGLGDLMGGASLTDFLLPAAVIGSAALSYTANQDAAKRAEEAGQQQQATIRQAQGLAQQRIDQQLADTAGALDYTKSQMNGATTLTPEQRIAVDEAGRATADQFAGAGFSGRTGTAAVRKNVGDLTASYLGANRNRADTAARTLEGERSGAVQAGINLPMSAAGGVAGVQGQVAETQSNAELANASMTGRALADITSLINEDKKDRRRYGTPVRVSESVVPLQPTQTPEDYAASFT